MYCSDSSSNNCSNLYFYYVLNRKRFIQVSLLLLGDINTPYISCKKDWLQLVAASLSYLGLAERLRLRPSQTACNCNWKSVLSSPVPVWSQFFSSLVTGLQNTSRQRCDFDIWVANGSGCSKAWGELAALLWTKTSKHGCTTIPLNNWDHLSEAIM